MQPIKPFFISGKFLTVNDTNQGRKNKRDAAMIVSELETMLNDVSFVEQNSLTCPFGVLIFPKIEFVRKCFNNVS